MHRLRALWDDAFLLILLLAAIVVAHALVAADVHVPAIADTGLAWMQQRTPDVAWTAGVAVAFLIAIAASHRRAGQGMRAVAWALLAAGGAAAIFVQPALAGTAFLSAGNLLRRHRAAAPPAP